MDKRIILAVAGSGKTTYIVNQLTLDKRSLVVTYTTRNYLNLKNSILRKFGHIPETITLMSLLKKGCALFESGASCFIFMLF